MEQSGEQQAINNGVMGEAPPEPVHEVDLWEKLNLPLAPEPVQWTMNVVAGTDDEGKVEHFGLVHFVSGNHISRLWFRAQGIENLISFLNVCKKTLEEANEGSKPKLAVARSQLIIPGQHPPMPQQP